MCLRIGVYRALHRLAQLLMMDPLDEAGIVKCFLALRRSPRIGRAGVCPGQCLAERVSDGVPTRMLHC